MEILSSGDEFFTPSRILRRKGIAVAGFGDDGLRSQWIASTAGISDPGYNHVHKAFALFKHLERAASMRDAF